MEEDYEYYEKEQAYLSAEREHMMYLTEYLNKVVRFTITGDSLPLYMLVVDFDENDDFPRKLWVISIFPNVYG